MQQSLEGLRRFQQLQPESGPAASQDGLTTLGRQRQQPNGVRVHETGARLTASPVSDDRLGKKTGDATPSSARADAQTEQPRVERPRLEIALRATETSVATEATENEAEKDERATYLVDLPTSIEATRQENQGRVFNVYSQHQLARYQDQGHLPPIPVEKGLDFGAGAGTMLQVLGKYAKQLTLVDLNSKLLIHAQERAKQLGMTDRVLLDSRSIFDIDGPFDLASFRLLFQAIPVSEQQETVNKLADLLRSSNGNLVAAEMATGEEFWKMVEIDGKTPEEASTLIRAVEQLTRNMGRDPNTGTRMKELFQEAGANLYEEPTSYIFQPPYGHPARSGPTLDLLNGVKIPLIRQGIMTEDDFHHCIKVVKACMDNSAAIVSFPKVYEIGARITK